MGASTSKSKRGDDSYKAISPPIDHHHHQSNDHIAKRRKISVSTSQNTTEYSRYMPSNSVVSKVSSYPDTKSRFSREVHARVRNSKFGAFPIAKKFDIGAGYKESSSNEMGNIMEILERYKKAKNSAIKSLRHVTKEDEEFGRKEKKIEIDVDDEEKKNKQDDVCDDSVRNSKFTAFPIAKKFDIGLGSTESSSNKMGNFMGIMERHKNAKISALEKLRLLTQNDEEFGKKDKKIEIDVDDEEKKNKQDDVYDDPGQLKSKPESRSIDSAVVTDVNQPNRKLDLMVLDQEQDDLSLPHCMKLLDLIRERELLSYKTKYDIDFNEKRSRGY